MRKGKTERAVIKSTEKKEERSKGRYEARKMFTSGGKGPSCSVSVGPEHNTKP